MPALARAIEETWASSALAADRPELHLEAGKLTRDMEGEPARALHRLPVGAGAIELEIGDAGMIRDLARRNRQRPDRDAGQRRIYHIPDILDRSQLDVGRKVAAQ